MFNLKFLSFCIKELPYCGEVKQREFGLGSLNDNKKNARITEVLVIRVFLFPRTKTITQRALSSFKVRSQSETPFQDVKYEMKLWRIRLAA